MKYTWGQGHRGNGALFGEEQGWQLLAFPADEDPGQHNVIVALGGIKHEYIAKAIVALLNADRPDES